MIAFIPTVGKSTSAMDFSHVLHVLNAAQGRDAWVAVTSGAADQPQAAVLHGTLGEVETPPEASIPFLPVEIPSKPDLHGSVGVALDSAKFEGAEGSLPGDLRLRLGDFNVCVSTR